MSSSYIAIELDALNQAPLVARALKVDEDAIIAGLARMWAHCFRQKVDHLEAIQVHGCFSTPDPCAALIAFGFLESADGRYRVRGAQRYLRITEGRSKGGKMAAQKGNLKRGTKGPSSNTQAGDNFPATPSTAPSSSPAPPQLDASLSPTTDDRRPTTEATTLPPASRSAGSGELDLALSRPSKPSKQPKAEKPPTAPGWQDLIDSLSIHWLQVKRAKYLWSGRDFKALERLREKKTDEEIIAYWLRGLRGTYKREVNSVTELEDKWNALSTDEPTKQSNVAATPDSYWDSIPEGGREVKL